LVMGVALTEEQIELILCEADQVLSPYMKANGTVEGVYDASDHEIRIGFLKDPHDNLPQQ
jgi:hypothetical protein